MPSRTLRTLEMIRQCQRISRKAQEDQRLHQEAVEISVAVEAHPVEEPVLALHLEEEVLLVIVVGAVETTAHIGKKATLKAVDLLISPTVIAVVLLEARKEYMLTNIVDRSKNREVEDVESSVGLRERTILTRVK